MGMGVTENSTLSYLQPTDSWSSDTVNWPLFCIVICRRLLGVTLDVHESDTVCVDTACVFLRIWLIFCDITSVPCIVDFPGHLLSYEILLAVREWEQEGMGITSGNGNKIRLNLWVWMGMGINHWKWEKGMGINHWKWEREWEWKRHSRTPLPRGSVLAKYNLKDDILRTL